MRACERVCELHYLPSHVLSEAPCSAPSPYLHGHMGQQQVVQNFDIASVIERAKHQHAFQVNADVQHSSLA